MEEAMTEVPKILKCGCRLCGCVCADHSADGEERLCAVHIDRAVFRLIAEEAGSLVAIALFSSAVLVWAVILG